MTLSKYIWVTLIVTFNPIYWGKNHSTNHQLDLLLIDLIKKYDFKYIDIYHTSIGGHYFWIANHPYASFSYATHLWDISKRTGIVNSHVNMADLKWGTPSRIVIYLAYQKYKKDIKNEKQ